jgi:glycerol uptake facilitator-like aquaporin
MADVNQAIGAVLLEIMIFVLTSPHVIFMARSHMAGLFSHDPPLGAMPTQVLGAILSSQMLEHVFGRQSSEVIVRAAYLDLSKKPAMSLTIHMGPVSRP